MATVPAYMPDEHQFYPTVEECTWAFVAAESGQIPDKVWEPACGDGAISRLLEKVGYDVVSTDLVDRGYGRGGVDFFTQYKMPDGCGGIVTNFAFNLNDEFIEHAAAMAPDYMAMFLPANYWVGSENRRRMFERWRPARQYLLGWRPDYFKLGSPDQRCLFQWCVWDGRSRGMVTSILRNPSMAGGAHG